MGFVGLSCSPATSQVDVWSLSGARILGAVRAQAELIKATSLLVLWESRRFWFAVVLADAMQWMLKMHPCLQMCMPICKHAIQLTLDVMVCDYPQVLVDLLRQKCLEERLPDAVASSSTSSHYSSLSNAPEEWSQEEGKPCSGERLLLMFDR